MIKKAAVNASAALCSCGHERLMHRRSMTQPAREAWQLPTGRSFSQCVVGINTKVACKCERFGK